MDEFEDAIFYGNGVVMTIKVLQKETDKTQKKVLLHNLNDYMKRLTTAVSQVNAKVAEQI